MRSVEKSRTGWPTRTSTEGGSAYVPEIGRSLQTAPITSPGAFPDGQPGTQFTAVAGIWTPADQAQANVATEEVEGERQRTKEKEAAEQLQKCREEGGCGALGPSIVIEDPYWVWTFTISQATQLAGTIKGAEGYLT